MKHTNPNTAPIETIIAMGVASRELRFTAGGKDYRLGYWAHGRDAVSIRAMDASLRLCARVYQDTLP